MLSTIIAPEILPAWAFNQRNAAFAVKDLYNNPESMFSAFEVKKLLNCCSECMARTERAITEGSKHLGIRWLIVGFFRKLLKGTAPGGLLFSLSLRNY